MIRLSSLIVIFISIISISCKKQIHDITDQCDYFSTEYPCFRIVSDQDAMVITDEATFLELNFFRTKGASANGSCEDAKIPKIDFRHHSLISKKTFSYCYEYTYILTKDDCDDKLVCEFIPVMPIIDFGWGYRSDNWIIIPKLADSYTVEFIILEEDNL